MENPRRIVPTLLLACVIAALSVAPVGAGRVEIIRDEYGVPHVYGANLKSTWYGVGYAMCQDRLWQAEVLRRLGTGTSAEIFGPGSIAGDVTSRLVFGNPARRASMFNQASKGLKKVYRWYARGVNACIDDMKASGTLPIEYEALGLDPPRKWVVDDSIAIGMALLQNFGEAGADELDHLADLQELVARMGAGAGGNIFFDTHIPSDPTAPTSVPAGGAAAGVASGVVDTASLLESIPDIDAKRAATRFRAAFKGWRRNAERAGLGKGPASNAIAISPALSADGRPLLLAGPQMGYTTPQVNHEMGIHGGGYNVTGMAIAGIPAVAIGVTDKHAWTLTTGGTDNNDIYLETLNPSNPAQYAFGGSFRNLDCRQETIPVRGAPAHVQVLCETLHGALVAQQGGVAFSLKTATRGLELESIEGLHGMMTAKNIRAFDRALSRPAYNFNVLYADVKGNIAYWHAGRIPVRAPGDSPWFPHIGAGIAEWQGFIPWSQMPHARNPSQGWLTSWNNKPQVSWPNSTRGFWQWGPVARVRTLMRLLGALPPGSATMQTVAQINQIAGHTTDSPSGNASTVVVTTLLGDLLGHVDTDADARLGAVVGMLSSWNLLQLDLDVDGRYDSPAVAIFNTWWQTFINRVFADDLGGTMERNVVANLAGRLVKPGLVPLRHNYLGGESVAAAVTGALIDALDSLTASYGSASIASWLQPAPMTSWSPIGAVGVPETPWMNRGTYNQITRVARNGNMFAQNVIAPGQSGNPFSPHFADQLLNYATWTYKPMRLNRASLKGNTESTTVLQATK